MKQRKIEKLATPVKEEDICNELYNEGVKIAEKYKMPILPKCLMKPSHIDIQDNILRVKKTEEQLYFEAMLYQIQCLTTEGITQLTEELIEELAHYVFDISDGSTLFKDVGDNIKLEDRIAIIKCCIESCKITQDN